MLIETDKIDWSKPVIYWDTKDAYLAVLVSKNANAQGNYGIVVYNGTVSGGKRHDGIKYSDENGCETGYGGSRRFFNYAPETKSRPPELSKLELNLKEFGQF